MSMATDQAAFVGTPSAEQVLQTRVDNLVQQLRTNPNNAALLGEMQKILAQTNRAPAIQRLLFEWYTIPNLDPNLKSVLFVILIDTIRHDAQIADKVNFGLDTSSAAYKAIHRGMAYHLNNAVESLNLITRLQKNQYTVHTAPKFIVAIPKSGSSLLGICLGNMVRFKNEGQIGPNPFEWRGYPAWWDQGSNCFDWDLRPEIGADPLFMRYPGGVSKGHIEPIPKNFHVLRL